MEIKFKDDIERKRCDEHDSLLFDKADPDRVYSIDFKITNASRAEYILFGLLKDKIPDLDLGINITSINVMGLEESKKVKALLYEAIERIIPY